jgi:hypothetical protein
MRTITAFVFGGMLIALPAAAQTSGGRGAVSGTGSDASATVGVGPGGGGATKAGSRSCEKPGICEVPLTGRYMQIVNSMARLACGRCASW